ncbi:DUF4232 domain-containing protein [Streptomyces sp. NPDC059785]|uniref:DUF4232 domain-containing protein n=1 Tax=Streptomyces sp. NPDC059785 TaxID=3346945 RepID=UPI00364B0844
MRIRSVRPTRSARPVRSVLALAAALAAVLVSAPQGSAAVARPADCPERALTVRATASDDPRVLHVAVTNRLPVACALDRFPTVTFGDLDGAALPVPDGESAPYRIGAGATVHAAVRTVADPADPEARRVGSVGVAVAPSHHGRSFTARELGAGDAVLVWEPVTTWWQPSEAAADRTLGLNLS